MESDLRNNWSAEAWRMASPEVWQQAEARAWQEIAAWATGWMVWAATAGVAVMTVLVMLYVVYLRYANRSSVRSCTTPEKLEGKTVVVTANENGGVGLAVARDLAGRGARVILAAPNLSKAQQEAASIAASTNNPQVTGLQLDTSCMASVTAFAELINATEKRLEVLVLAAGCGAPPCRTETAEGLEVTMATNHLGHFLLVNLLLGVMVKSCPSRVVVQASSAHYLLSSINPKDLNQHRGQYGALAAYSLSQLCNVLMTTNLAHLTAGTGVVVNSACPGLVWEERYLCGDGVLARLYTALLYCVARTPEEGAQTLIHAAVSHQGAKLSGAFFTNCTETKLTGLAADAGLAKKVWEVSEGLVGLLPPDHV